MQGGFTALMFACHESHNVIVTLLLDGGAGVNVITEVGLNLVKRALHAIITINISS